MVHFQGKKQNNMTMFKPRAHLLYTFYVAKRVIVP